MPVNRENFEAAKGVAFRSLIKKTNSWEKHGSHPTQTIEAVRLIADMVQKLEYPEVATEG